jgi:hypothetical protein
VITLDPHHERRLRGFARIGVFLLVLAVYLLSSPGRIDSFDSQWRYEVTRNLINHHQPDVRDPALVHNELALRGPHGAMYTRYSAAASITTIPWVVAGRSIGGDNSETERFVFSLVSAFFGAFTSLLLLGFYFDLGLSRRRAVGWTLAASFASLLWPLSCTTLDNIQHAFFVLASLRLARQSAQRTSIPLALVAGVVGGVLVNYQEAFGFVLPMLALATLKSDMRRASLTRYAVYGVGALLGVLAWMFYNYLRLGTPFDSGKLDTTSTHHPPVFGNPLIGALSLLFSPGRSVFLYSPTLFLGVLGFGALWRRERWLAIAIVATSMVHFAIISSLTFFAGDWCWGPRYLGCLLPLWAIAAPFAITTPSRSTIARALIVASLCVQLLGVSVEHTVFFINHQMPTYFWYRYPWIYFSHSALLDRPSELVRVLRTGRTPHARHFAPTLHQGSATSGPVMPAGVHVWPSLVPQYLIYHVPRPWPFWVGHIGRARRPLQPQPAIAVLFVLAITGAELLRRATRKHDETPSAML